MIPGHEGGAGEAILASKQVQNFDFSVQKATLFGAKLPFFSATFACTGANIHLFLHMGMRKFHQNLCKFAAKTCENFTKNMQICTQSCEIFTRFLRNFHKKDVHMQICTQTM